MKTHLGIDTIWKNSVLFLPFQIISTTEFGKTPEKNNINVSYVIVDCLTKKISAFYRFLYIHFFFFLWSA